MEGLDAYRDLAIPVVSAQELQRWASEQASLERKLYDHPISLIRFAGHVRSCGGDTGDLKIAAYGSDYLSFQEIAERRDWPEEILLINLEYILDMQEFHEEFTLDPRVMAVPKKDYMSWYPMGDYSNILRHPGVIWPPQIALLQNAGLEPGEYFTLRMAVIEALAIAWNTSLEEVLRVSSLFGELPHKPIGSNQMPAKHRIFGKMKMGESDLEDIADVIRMPKPAE